MQTIRKQRPHLTGRTLSKTFTEGNTSWQACRAVYLPSLFMADWKHLESRQARHWLRWVLSTGQRPFSSPAALHVYTRFRWMLRLKNPEQPAREEKRGVFTMIATLTAPLQRPYHRNCRCRSVCPSCGRRTLCTVCLAICHLNRSGAKDGNKREE